MENDQKYIINFGIDTIDGVWKIIPSVDGKYKAPLNNVFKTYDDAEKYLTINRDKLIKKYTPRLRKKKEPEEIQENNTKKGGKVAIFAVGALAGITTAAFILTSCNGCKGKGTKNATDKNNASIVFSTNTPMPTAEIDDKVTLAPTSTPYVTIEPTIAPTEVVDTLSVEVIEKKASDIYNKYNEFKSGVQVIVGDKLVTLKLTEKDIMNAIICLNCDYLENEHYTTFLQLRSGRDVDSVIDSYQDVITFIQQLNLQKYMANKSTKDFMPLSCLLLDDESRESAENFENCYLKIMDANLGYDAWKTNTKSSKKAKRKVRELTDIIIDSASSNNVGLTGIMSIDYSVLASMCNGTMRKDQRRVLFDLCDEYENTNYNAIKGILMSDSIVNSPECYNPSSLVKTRYL